MQTFVPSLGTGEVFAFGAGVPLPTRMKFRDVPEALRPASEAGGNTRIAAGASADRGLIDSVIERWRASSMSKSQQDEEGGELGSWRDDVAPPREEIPRYQAAPPVQPAMQPPPMPAAPAQQTMQPPHAYAAVPAAASAAPAYEQPPPPPRPSILRRPLSSEPLGPNNPAPLPSRYR
jgi:hypothetical protein